MAYGLPQKVAGLIVGAGHAVSSLVAPATAIPVGNPVFVKLGEDGVAYGAPGTDIVFHGVHRYVNLPTPVAPGDSIPVVRSGVINVTVAEAVDAYAPAYITAGGKFGAAGTAIKARYLTSAAANGIAEIELDIN